MIHPMHGIRRFGLCLVLTAMGLVAASPPASAAEKKEQQISRVIAKEMMAAQKALQASQWAEALKNLDAAEAKGGLTEFDKKTILDFKGFANVRLGNLKAAQANYEAALATGLYSPEDAARTTRTLFRLAAGAQEYTKAVGFGKTVVDNGSANSDDYLIMTQSYYLLKDCKDAVVWADKAIAFDRKAGEAPKENLFLFKLQCAADANDTPATVTALEDLIRLNGKPDYWNKLLRIERQEQKDDHSLLMIYRLMFDTNSMNAGSDYIEMAQLLGDAGLPGEAESVLEKGISSGQIPQEQRERSARLLNAIKARAESDKKGLAQFDAEATKNPAGELDVKLGEVYYGFGDYQNAVKAIQAGLQKGQIKHLDEAYVYLGRAEAALKNGAEARKAFLGLKPLPGANAQLVKLFDLYGEKVG
jgi:hypothetical protein